MGKGIKRISAVLVLIIVVSTCLSSCGNTNRSKDSTIKVGFMVDSLVIERWQKDRDIFTAKARELGMEVILKNANEDAEMQNQQIEELVEQGVDVIVIIPYDKASVGQSLKQAKRAGVNIIAYDRLVEDGDIDAYISFDNNEVGRLMGQALVDKVPEGNYVILNGSPKDHNSTMFNEGYMSVIQDQVTSGQITIAKEIWAEDWREIYAYDTVSSLIEEGVTIDGIIGGNDDLAEGAIRALLERQLADHVVVVGHDANLSACQRIVEGTQYVTIYKPIKHLAQEAAIKAYQLATHQEGIFDEASTIYDGSKEVPYIKIKPYLVTKDNMMEVIVKDGFHMKEEVYRNVPESEWPND